MDRKEVAQMADGTEGEGPLGLCPGGDDMALGRKHFVIYFFNVSLSFCSPSSCEEWKENNKAKWSMSAKFPWDFVFEEMTWLSDMSIFCSSFSYRLSLPLTPPLLLISSSVSR